MFFLPFIPIKYIDDQKKRRLFQMLLCLVSLFYWSDISSFNIYAPNFCHERKLNRLQDSANFPVSRFRNPNLNSAFVNRAWTSGLKPKRIAPIIKRAHSDGMFHELTGSSWARNFVTALSLRLVITNTNYQLSRHRLPSAKTHFVTNSTSKKSDRAFLLWEVLL